MLQQNRTLDGVTADNMTLGALRLRGWRFSPKHGADVDDTVTLGALRSRGWQIYPGLCLVVQGAGGSLPAPAVLPATASLPAPTPAVVPARPPLPPVATAPAPAPPIPAPSIEDRALAAVRQVAATASPPSVAEAAAARWRVSPEVRAEFRDNLPAYLTYCQARTAGRIRIIRDRTIIAYNLAPPGEPRPATMAERALERQAAAAAPPALDPNLSLEQRAAAEWRHSPGLRVEFGNQLNHYVAFLRAEERGQVRRLAPAHRSLPIALGDSVGARA